MLGNEDSSAAEVCAVTHGGEATAPRSAFQRSPLPAVMAIINRTPDSFYDRGHTASLDAAIRRISDVAAAGADVIDIGGVKAGPGPVVSVAEEIDRVVPTITAAKDQFPDIFVSVDTWRADVAEAAIAAGADIINDTWSGYDPQLIEVAGAHQVGYVCSHTGGVTPRTRPHRVHYRDVVAAVRRDTAELAEKACQAGVPVDKILIDPTHDFGKNTHHGLELLRRLPELTQGDYPVLMAMSNKDFIGETLGRDVQDRVAGSLAATAWSCLCGVAMLRVHEVAATVDACRMIAAITGAVAPLSTVRGLQ